MREVMDVFIFLVLEFLVNKDSVNLIMHQYLKQVDFKRWSRTKQPV